MRDRRRFSCRAIFRGVMIVGDAVEGPAAVQQVRNDRRAANGRVVPIGTTGVSWFQDQLAKPHRPSNSHLSPNSVTSLDIERRRKQ